MKVNKKCKFNDINTNLAFKITRFKSEPIAILAFTIIKAKESLMLSLTIATIAFPILLLRLKAKDCSQQILSAFSEGRTLAIILIAKNVSVPI